MAGWLTCMLTFGLLCGESSAGQPAPDTSAVLSVIGRFDMAHACPVAEDRALTNAHVLDIRPFDPSTPLVIHRFSTSDRAVEGILEPVFVSVIEDIGLAIPRNTKFQRFYPIAAAAPQPGDRVWWLMYDWSSRRNMFVDKVVSGKVLRTVAGNIVIDTPTQEGSSGGCILNADGQVVGLVAWGVGDQNTEVTVGVGVYGPWIRDLLTLPTKAPQSTPDQGLLEQILGAVNPPAPPPPSQP